MERRSVRITSLVALLIVLATDVLYVALIRSQGSAPQPYLPIFVAGYLVLMAALIAIALIPRPALARARPAVRIAATTGLVVLGFVAAFSIGVPLLAAGLLVLVALVRSAPVAPPRFAFVSGVVAGSLALVLLVAGLEVTDRLIVCPATGTASGTGRGIVTGAYHYQCNEGTLSFHSG